MGQHTRDKQPVGYVDCGHGGRVMITHKGPRAVGELVGKIQPFVLPGNAEEILATASVAMAHLHSQSCGELCYATSMRMTLDIHNARDLYA